MYSRSYERHSFRTGASLPPLATSCTTTSPYEVLSESKMIPQTV
jgi:hypothetical protein